MSADVIGVPSLNTAPSRIVKSQYSAFGPGVHDSHKAGTSSKFSLLRRYGSSPRLAAPVE
jgi:hypothetical protein